jgi:hypothetical protein
MRVVFIVIPLVIVAAIGGFVAWKIAGLKQRLVAELEAALHATAQIDSLNLDLGKGELLAAGITLQNQRPEAPWDSASIDQAVIHFQFAKLFAPTMPLQVTVSGWKVTLRPTMPGSSAPDSGNSTASSGSVPAEAGPSWIQVNGVDASEGEVTVRLSDTQSVAIHGVKFHSDTPTGATWTTQLSVTSIAAGTFVTDAGSVQLHSDNQQVTFSDLAIRCADGQITGGGNFDLTAPHALKGSFTATNVPITMLVAARWQVKLSGAVSGNMDYQGDDSSSTATGKFSVSGGKFNLFPWLGKAQMLVGLPDVGDTEVDQATSDYSWKNHILSLQNIDVRKQSVFRIGGKADIAADSTIDGHLKLGLPTTAVSKWPKLQTDVFNVAQDDFSWTDVHVTGMPDQLQEDLSPRLLSVTAAQGAQLLQQTKQGATDLINQLLK